ncbi:MAG: hypothetical protein BWX88_02013 [Planctomycetes bacterium ADurb.Bin126]|nr:MAG: hypothetical protein BWX88_02013 [Planctomycetes bacterium ADurb.Bin126]
MLRYVAEPFDAGGFEFDGGVEAAGDGLVDDGLLLFLQQPDQLPLRRDVLADPPVGMIQETDNRGLLGERGDRNLHTLYRVMGEPVSSHAVRLYMVLVRDSPTLERAKEKAATHSTFAGPKNGEVIAADEIGCLTLDQGGHPNVIP